MTFFYSNNTHNMIFGVKYGTFQTFVRDPNFILRKRRKISISVLIINYNEAN